MFDGSGQKIDLNHRTFFFTLKFVRGLRENTNKLFVAIGFLWLLDYILGLLQAPDPARRIIHIIVLMLLLLIFWTPFFHLQF